MPPPNKHRLNKMKQNIKFLVGVMFGLILLSSLHLVSASELEDNTIHLNVGQESGYIPEFKDINIKFSEIIPNVCKMAPCPEVIEIVISKKDVLNKKANVFTLVEGNSLEVYGVNIKLINVENDTASFVLSNGKEEIVPSEEKPILTVIESPDGTTENIKIEIIGEKTMISIGGATGRDCEEYLKECNSGNQILCEKWQTNCQEKNISLETKEEIKIKENKLYMNDKEIKVMPDTASEKAIATLELKKDVIIELKDTGKLIYEITGEKEVKILALFKTEMQVKTQIDAQTGNVDKIEKPWWSFLAK